MSVLDFILGTRSAGSANLGTKTITQNGTYNASDDGYNGYSQVTVNVLSGLVYQDEDGYLVLSETT